MTRRVLFVSVEASGDDLAVDVIRELRRTDATLDIKAIGGRALEAVGLVSPLDLSPMGVIGMIDALKAFSKALQLVKATVEYAIQEDVSAIVLIDAWGFSIRVAERLKKKAPNIQVIKLIGPQVWATRPGRAKALARSVDHLLCIHEFEVPFYEPFGLDCTVIGNPAIARMKKGNGAAFRSRYGIEADDHLLLVLPGSRRLELRRIAPVFLEAVSAIKTRYGAELELAVLVSPSVRDDASWQALRWPEGTRLIEDPSEKADTMAGATLALACSGTVTTELATQGCPMVVGYKLGWLTWAIAKLFLMKSKYITLANIAVGREAVPELIQTSLTAKQIEQELVRLIESEALRARQKEDLKLAAQLMGNDKPPAHIISARAISSYLSA